MQRLFSTLRFIVSHPLNRSRRIAAIFRYLRWQVGIRILPGAAAVPFVNKSRLLVTAGMTGATGNIYCGLHEFEDMAFVLHSLRAGDCFVDVGANIGSYTVLAAQTGCDRCISVEPSSTTFNALLANISLNGLEAVVDAKHVGAGSSQSRLSFTTGQDTVNHIIMEKEDLAAIEEIDVLPLDVIVGKIDSPTIVKIDVEGFESAVLAGASDLLKSKYTWALLMELNGSGAKYGFDESDVHERVLRAGFFAMEYEPFSRTLSRLSGKNAKNGNTLYVKNLEAIRQRLESAPRFAVWNGSI